MMVGWLEQNPGVVQQVRAMESITNGRISMSTQYEKQSHNHATLAQ
jgi:hypothetical protein